MLIDGRTLSSETVLKADVCIIGAGPAGITLALELQKSALTVILLESGGKEKASDAATQSLQRLDVVGHPYWQNTRERGFAGSSHGWYLESGWRGRPLDAIDFEQRSAIADSGWPFGLDTLEPYYERAQTVCNMGPYQYNPREWHTPDEHEYAILDQGQLRSGLFQRGPIHQFKTYWKTLAESANTRVVLHATVTQLHTEDSPQVVNRVQATNFTGCNFAIKAKTFVLAMGGMENPRLLLASNQTHSAGLGNQHDVVGRYFMEHPHIHTGWFYPFDRSFAKRLEFYRYHKVNQTAIEGFVALKETLVRQEGLPNVAFWLHKTSMRNTLTTALTTAAKVPKADEVGKYVRNLRKQANHLLEIPYQRALLQSANRHFSLEVEAEQTPNPASRVTLVREKDPFGVNRLQFDWRVAAGDFAAIRRSQQLLDQELRRAGIGWVDCFYGDEFPAAHLGFGNHHMGTTRMNTNSKKGVVDENAKVHGLANLFIAGSSVFPTSGAANPTLTVIAMALRLADHLKQQAIVAGATCLSRGDMESIVPVARV